MDKYFALLKDYWSSSMTNLRRYRDEISYCIVGMKEEHLPRFKKASWHPSAQDHYFHVTRNLFTEAFRAMPRTLSGLFILWCLWKLFWLVAN